MTALVSLSAWAEDLAGHYVLKDVMEVGSELLLKPDGHFEYMLAYGAADYWAKGTWRHEKEQVILNSDGKKEAPFKAVGSSSEGFADNGSHTKRRIQLFSLLDYYENDLAPGSFNDRDPKLALWP
jgi:hypothetical protein